eukprot:gene3831-4221_t
MGSRQRDHQSGRVDRITWWRTPSGRPVPWIEGTPPAGVATCMYTQAKAAMGAGRRAATCALTCGVAAICYAGMFAFPEGQEAALRWAYSRGPGRSTLRDTFLYLPALLYCGGDSNAFLRRCEAAAQGANTGSAGGHPPAQAQHGREHAGTPSGPAFPFGDGVALTSWDSVSAVLASPHPASPHADAFPSGTPCFAPHSPSALPDGPAHARVRSAIAAVVRGEDGEGGELGWWSKLLGHSGALPAVAVSFPPGAAGLPRGSPAAVEQTLASTLFRAMFGGGAPPQTAVHAALVSMGHAKRCATPLRHLHRLSGYAAVSGAASARQEVADHILATPAGDQIPAAAAEAGLTSDEAASLPAILADVYVAMGLARVAHITAAALARLEASPARHLALWRRDPAAFLLETARLDPPVASAPALAGIAVNVSLPYLGGATVDQGTPVELVYATANRDPAVFGGPAQSPARAATFDPSRPELSKMCCPGACPALHQARAMLWNGLESSLPSAHRACPGRGLSLQVAAAVVEAPLPGQADQAGHGLGGPAKPRAHAALDSSWLAQ